MIGPGASSVASSAIVGKPTSGCLASRLRAIGRISATSVSTHRSHALYSHQNQWHRPVTGQIGYAWNASLFYLKGGAAVTDNRFSVLDTLRHRTGGAKRDPLGAEPWGVGWEYGFAPNWSAGIEYDHLFMGHQIIRSDHRSASCRVSQRPDHPGCGHDHSAHQLSLRRLQRRSSRNTVFVLIPFLQQLRPADRPAPFFGTNDCCRPLFQANERRRRRHISNGSLLRQA